MTVSNGTDCDSKPTLRVFEAFRKIDRIAELVSDPSVLPRECGIHDELEEDLKVATLDSTNSRTLNF